MLQFHQITLEDKPVVDRFCAMQGSRSADFNFCNMYIWDELYRRYICSHGDRLIVLTEHEDGPLFCFPIGGGSLEGAFREMDAYARAGGFPLRVLGIEREQIGELNAAFPNQFSFSENREYADYIYSAESLATLGGRKLHGKRNHINQFTAQNPDWRFEEISRRNIPDCLALFERWAELSEGRDGSNESERAAVHKAFGAFDELGLLGGVLYSGSRPVAFTAGEIICRDTLDVHFEKALPDVTGAYTMINREFVAFAMKRDPLIRYVNREDDMGMENLRKAKESYHPEYLLRKFTAVRSGSDAL